MPGPLRAYQRLAGAAQALIQRASLRQANHSEIGSKTMDSIACALSSNGYCGSIQLTTTTKTAATATSTICITNMNGTRGCCSSALSRLRAPSIVSVAGRPSRGFAMLVWPPKLRPVYAPGPGLEFGQALACFEALTAIGPGVVPAPDAVLRSG